MEKKYFEVVNLNDLNVCEIFDIDGLYDFFVESLGEVDADIILGWAVECQVGEMYESYPALPYMITCRE